VTFFRSNGLKFLEGLSGVLKNMADESMSISSKRRRINAKVRGQ
jgi:hypothetical protein